MDQNNIMYPCNNSNHLNYASFNSEIDSPFMGFSNSIVLENQQQYEQLRFYHSQFVDRSVNMNLQICHSSAIASCSSENIFQVTESEKCSQNELASSFKANDSDFSVRSIIFETPIKEESLDLSINTLNQDIILPYNPEFIQVKTSETNAPPVLPDQLKLNAEFINLNDSSIDVESSLAESNITQNSESDKILENVTLSASDIKLETPRKKIESESSFPSSCLKKPNLMSPIKKSISFNQTVEITPTGHNSTYCEESAEFSPELFSDDDEFSPSRNESKIDEADMSFTNASYSKNTSSQDKKLLKRLQESCAGILPPPSVTICQLNSANILTKYNENKMILDTSNSCDNANNSTSKIATCNRNKSILLNCSETEAKDYLWPNIMEKRFHGLHYNRSKVSEEIEHLCQKYADRFIGCETASSCTVWEINAPNSASKRRMIRKQTVKSPGRRLSHLARRRITFSKENISAKGSVLPNISTSTRQILVKRNSVLMRRFSPQKGLSPRKAMTSPRKMISPRKRTPRKTPNGRSPRKRMTTPGNSAKKRASRRLLLTNCEENQTISTTTFHSSTSKRTLQFQSPENRPTPCPEPTRLNKITESKILKSKRTLFSTPENKATVIDDNLGKKRKRSDSDDEFTPQRDKFARSLSTNDVPINRLSISQLGRRHSETFTTASSTDFTENHTKKMLWAISTALRSQNVGMSHPKFKTYAASLSQVCKQLLPDLLPGAVRIPGSVTERMSKITHQHVYAVIKGKSVDEIVREAKTKSAILSQKPKGYVALDGTESGLGSSIFETSEQKAEINKSKICRQIIFDKS